MTVSLTGKYDLEFKTEDSDPENHLEPNALLEQYTELRGELPIVATMIDPFDHEDWDGWSALMKAQPELQVVADQLTAMNKERIEEAVEKQAANCMMVRLPIAGTITDAIECVKMAKEAGWDCLVSAGECYYILTGGLSGKSESVIVIVRANINLSILW